MKLRTRIAGRLSMLAALVMTFALTGAATAFAQGSSANTYGGDGPQGVLAGGGGSGGSAEAAGAGAGALPFTGLDVGMALGGALLLIAAGLAVSRLVVRGSEV